VTLPGAARKNSSSKETVKKMSDGNSSETRLSRAVGKIVAVGGLASTEFTRFQTRACNSFHSNHLETGKSYRFSISLGIWFGSSGARGRRCKILWSKEDFAR